MSFFVVKNKFARFLLWQFFILLVIAMLGLIGYLYYLDIEVREKFEGSRWEVPSRVFARPLSLYEGKKLLPSQLEFELKLLRYNHSKSDGVGTYFRQSDTLYLHSRPFQFSTGFVDAAYIKISFRNGYITQLLDMKKNTELDFFTVEPYLIGGIYPRKQEDRVLVRIDEVPKSLIDTLLGVEDRHFYTHSGISPLSILRALLANIQAGARVQGGSTLTQQLVKNFFLSNEKTINRKINEALMSLLLELHYSKDEILEAYLNEIYLGQNGSRSIHGFGLASYFYFDQSLETLNQGQIALLVGLVKGASYYNPRRHPERAKQRRRVVLTIQRDLDLLPANSFKRFDDSRLGVKKDKPGGISRYPAFFDLVKQQLRQDYPPEDLASAGLRLFTTLDPLIQESTEQSIQKRLPQLERKAKLKRETLQVAAIVTDAGSGSVRALVGGRNFRGHGFNRALEASRHVGSLIKPAVYLTALDNPARYKLSTTLEDSPIKVDQGQGNYWKPENYDNQYHGRVSLISSLANSYNVSTVRLGMTLGLPEVSKTLKKLGIKRDIPLYPSMLLGALNLSPIEVMQMYQTISAQGFQTPIRGISSVTTAEGDVLSKYPISVKQTLKPESVYLITKALEEVMSSGTGRSAYNRLPYDFVVAGKSGTTNAYRDSWFAGMSGDKVIVVWLGADNNDPINLTGAGGALKIWTDVMASSAHRSLDVPVPERIVFAKVSALMHRKKREACEEDVVLPFVSGYLPAGYERVICDEEN
ncbi:MAG: penicillin-binding protein 1B [Gammaproteobacteria bacterium]|nr:penicillin-binding protein 1B [Gammaproteobacteria bacterium]